MAPSSAVLSGSAGAGELRETVRAGLLGGLVGGVIIWIYEAIVWVGVQHLMPMVGIPRNATGLVFGKDVQDSLGALAYVVGTGIHFFFALAWGVVFALLWPVFARRGYEAARDLHVGQASVRKTRLSQDHQTRFSRFAAAY